MWVFCPPLQRRCPLPVPTAGEGAELPVIPFLPHHHIYADVCNPDGVPYILIGIVTTNPSGSTTDDHALEIIGWGSEGSVDYWIGQNNWGTFWGEAGFFRIIRG